jgi:hypothetical protein
VSIYQDPTFPDADDIAISDDFLSLGCYTEGDSGRSLDYSQWNNLNISAMTTERCLTACGAKGFPFAGTEFGRECYCGVVLGNGTVSADSSQCATPCTGNSTQVCGGADRLSLYVAKNLESTEPCSPPVISSSSIPLPTSTTSITYSMSSSKSSSSTLQPTSTKSSSAITSVHSTTSVCIGYHCPKTTTTKTPCSSSTQKRTSTSCKTTPPSKPSTKSTPKPSSTAKSTSKIASSTQKSTLKTSTSCKTSPKTTAKTTVKTTSTRKYGGW